MRFMFKGCERCQGDLFKEDDSRQSDLVCLQCGHRQSLGVSALSGLKERLEQEEKKELVPSGRR